MPVHYDDDDKKLNRDMKWVGIFFVVFIIYSVFTCSCSYKDYVVVEDKQVVLIKKITRENDMALLWRTNDNIIFWKTINFNDTSNYQIGMTKEVLITKR